MLCRVLIADDHQIFRQGLRGILERAGHEVVGEAADGREALTLAQRLAPDIAILDLSMPLLNGLDVADQLRRTAPNVKTILLTMHADKAYVQHALRVGVRGYVLKTQAAEDLIRAIGEIAGGEVYLSAGVMVAVVDGYLRREGAADDSLTMRERQILQLVAEGKSTRDIATLLNISFKTAETHRGRMMKKLDVHDVASVVRYAIRQGLLHP
jgi:DNA-binding NarL/FixJ family response regulator